MKLSRNLVAVIALIAAGCPFTASQAGEKLSGSEIAALFPGEFEAVWKDKHEVSIVATGDGEVQGSTGLLSDTGQWSISGDQLCVAFYWWTGNRPRCTEVVREEGWYIGMRNSKGEPRVRFRPQ